MHPAPSLLLFTTLSGLGLGLLAFLGLDPEPPTGRVALVFLILAYGLALGGLAASGFHLGRRDRALKAFRQWRTSWLSREAWAALFALLAGGGYGLSLLFGRPLLPLGWLAALLALGTVGCTAMIYAQLRSVPRWHHWSTPALFLGHALAGGALLSGHVRLALALVPLSVLLQLWVWWDGDRRLARSGTDLGTATGLGARGSVRALMPPHTGANYLLREMVHVVGRRHAAKLRGLGTLLLILPAPLLLLPHPHLFGLLALVSHLAGVLVSRWLFFAEAEHVVGFYYGRR